MSKSIIIRNRYEQASVHVSDIAYIGVENRKVLIHTPDEVLWECCSMDEILYRIDDSRIFRCHQSLAVNLEHINAFSNGNVILQNGEELNMCRTAWQKTKRMWTRYKLGKKTDTRTGTERRKCSDRRSADGCDRRSIPDKE